MTKRVSPKERSAYNMKDGLEVKLSKPNFQLLLDNNKIPMSLSCICCSVNCFIYLIAKLTMGSFDLSYDKENFSGI